MNGGFDHVERHDDRIQLFATRLDEGRHEFSYIVRATTAGTFRTAPAHAEEMYEPEVFGRTETAIVEVQPMTFPRHRARSGLTAAIAARWRLIARAGVAACRPAARRAARLPIRSNRRRCSIGMANCLYESRAGDGTRARVARCAMRFRPTSCPRRSRQKTAASTATSVSIRSPSHGRPGATCGKVRSSKADRRSASRWRNSCSHGRMRGRQTRGLSAKIREAIVAFRLEHRLSKREILTLYLNLAPYGNQIQGARAREPRVLRIAGQPADARAGGLHRRTPSAAVAVQSVSSPGRRTGTAETRHRPHGRARGC